MLTTFFILFVLALFIWFMRSRQRKAFLKKKTYYKEPIYAILSRYHSEMRSCAQINTEMKKSFVSLKNIADVELYPILDEMVTEGSLIAKPFTLQVGDMQIKLMKYGVHPDGSRPPPPPREESEESVSTDYTVFRPS